METQSDQTEKFIVLLCSMSLCLLMVRGIVLSQFCLCVRIIRNASGLMLTTTRHLNIGKLHFCSIFAQYIMSGVTKM